MVRTWGNAASSPISGSSRRPSNRILRPPVPTIRICRAASHSRTADLITQTEPGHRRTDSGNRPRDIHPMRWTSRTHATYTADWALFVDWCDATDHQPLPADPATVLAFL